MIMADNNSICQNITTHQTAAHKRVMQLRQLATFIRRRAMSCNKLPEDKSVKGVKMDNEENDDEIRPRTLSSTAVDGANKLRRRSMRKQRYYGSSELMVSTNINGDIKSGGRYRLEPADSEECVVYSGDNELPTNPVMLEDPEVETRWYIRHFLGREHQNFAGVDNQKSPYFLSVQIDEEVEGTRCRAILWQCSGAKRLVFPYHHASQKSLTVKSVMQKFPGINDLNHNLKEITDPKLQKDLLLLEEQEGAVNFKFGVIYALNDQQTDDEMFSNENGSQQFHQFLELLGDKIQLQNWMKFRGGLDNKSNSTGNFSYYTLYEGHEIMFHVSTFLPYSIGNKQQLERKRHIGNDIVNVIFLEGGDPKNLSFNPSYMKSQFTHIFAVVTYEAKFGGIYRLWIFSEETVPAYGPALPNPAEFTNFVHFKQFLLTKIINGEKAAFRSQIFSEKRRRTADTLIKDMYMEYLKKEFHKGHLPKMNDTLIRQLKSPKNKELDNNLLEFLQMGEHLKLTKSLNGEAPNLLTVNHLYRKQPWKPQFLSSELPHYDYVASDSWSNRTLLLATDEIGTLSVNETVCTILYDQNAQVRRLNILENFGILLVQFENGKENYLSVFSLLHLRSCIRSALKLQKFDCLENKISTTKGCQLYAVTGNQSFRLSMVVNVGRKINLFKWNLSQITQLQSSTDIARHFEFIKDIHVHEDPLGLCIFESGVQATVKVAVVNKNGVDILDFSSSSVSLLYKVSLSKSTVTSFIASCDINSEDILLTFGNTTFVFDLCEEDCKPMSICWMTDPKSIAYCFPFLLAFGSDTIEIRLAVNGNLFASLYMPKVNLLASREDIFFCTDEQPWPFSNNNNPNNGRITTKQNFLRLYKIPYKNLLKSDSSPSPSQPGARSPVSPRTNRVQPPTTSKMDTTKPKLISPVFSRKDSFGTKPKADGFSDNGYNRISLNKSPEPDERKALSPILINDISDVLL